MSSEAGNLWKTPLRNATGFLDFAPLGGMTEKLFDVLDVYREAGADSAAMNMAIDEALLDRATRPAIRFYRWQSPALSFGYFGRFADVAGYQHERDLVRRWTGGGIVFHGKDITYSIVIPFSAAAFAESSTSIYEKIHRGFVDVLSGIGTHAVVAGGMDFGGVAVATRAAVSASGYNCFTNPVRSDVMMDGRKIAGAAQRRTRRGLLQQGSIQGIELGDNLTERFAQALSSNCREQTVDKETLKRAQELTRQKYGTEGWLRKR
jgi:lipoyl(octanoyl) transferase